MLEFDISGIFLNHSLQKALSITGLKSDILLKSNGSEKLVLYGYSDVNEQFLYISLDAAINNEGLVSINGNKLSILIKNIATNISFKETDNYLSLKADNKTFKLHKVEDVKYITPDKYKEALKNPIIIESMPELCNTLNKIKFACEKDNIARPYLSTLLLYSENNKVKILSSDGGMICKSSIKLSGNISNDLITSSAVDGIFSLFKDHVNDDGKLIICDSHIGIVTKNIQFFFPKLVHKWPDVLSIFSRIENEYTDKFELPTIHFRETLLRASAFFIKSKDGWNSSDSPITFSINGQVKIRIKDEFEEIFEIDNKELKTEFKLDPLKLTNIMKYAKLSDQIEISLNPNNNRIPIKIIDTEGTIFYIMPRI